MIHRGILYSEDFIVGRNREGAGGHHRWTNNLWGAGGHHRWTRSVRSWGSWGTSSLDGIWEELGVIIAGRDREPGRNWRISSVDYIAGPHGSGALEYHRGKRVDTNLRECWMNGITILWEPYYIIPKLNGDFLTLKLDRSSLQNQKLGSTPF